MRNHGSRRLDPSNGVIVSLSKYAGPIAAAAVLFGSLVAASPAQAAVTCGLERTKGLTDGSVRLTYTVCRDTDPARTRVSGRLYDEKENGYNACATITWSSGWSHTVVSDDYRGFDTGYLRGSVTGISIFNC
jgi:hypothetical protein